MDDDKQAMMTREEILADIGDKLSGLFIVQTASDARLITDVLREQGYRWKILHDAGNGNYAQIIFRFDP